jgi:glutamyl-tRNA synthetase
LLPSAARQILLQQALGFSSVSYLHVPLVVDQNGRRLAKRADDLSLRELRDGGTDPRAIVAWAAQSCGISCAERVTPSAVLGEFELKKLPKTPLVLDGSSVDALRAAR